MEGKKIIYGLGAVLIIAGISTGIYFIVRKPKEETSSLLPKGDDAPKDLPPSEQKGGGTEKNPSGCSAAGFDYSNPQNSGKNENGQMNSVPITKANKGGSKYSLGQKVIVKSGATVFRLDGNGCNVGSTKTDQRKALGFIWHINPAGRDVIIKTTSSGFSFPFYKTVIENLE